MCRIGTLMYGLAWSQSWDLWSWSWKKGLVYITGQRARRRGWPLSDSERKRTHCSCFHCKFQLHLYSSLVKRSIKSTVTWHW